MISSVPMQRPAPSAPTFDRVVLESVLELAGRAPSIHNTQPWSWVVDADRLSLRADRSRQLAVVDPDGHSLMISCGAALMLTELGLRAAGWSVTTERLPDPDDPDLLARFTNPRAVPATPLELDGADAALRRFSDRRPFTSELVPDELCERVRAASDGDGVHTHFPVRAEEQLDLAVAISNADRVERSDEAFSAELARWVRTDQGHDDGIQLESVPRVDVGHPRHTDVPLRDFEVGVPGRELIQRDVDERPAIVVLLTDSDSPAQQLRAGEAMMRLMVEAERLGLGCCPLSQAVDLLAFRSRLQVLMGWQGYPQMMVRLGYPSTSSPVPARTPRRPLKAVLHSAA
jgi:nitroreductase